MKEAVKAGADGYIMKDISLDDLAKNIRAVMEGHSSLAPQIATMLIKANKRRPSVGHDLTQREIEVLKLVVDGLSNRQIAEKLTISKSTVKNHVSRILGKLDATNRVEATRIAIDAGLVQQR